MQPSRFSSPCPIIQKLLICGWLLTIILLASGVIPGIEPSCNRVYQSSTSDSQAIQTFEAPNRANDKQLEIQQDKQGNLFIAVNSSESVNKVDKAIKTSKSNKTYIKDEFKAMHCIYKFIAKQDEQVALNFSSFSMRGDEPECSHEYLDIFVKFKSEDDINLDKAVGSEPPNGRFCTTIMPRRIVSLHNMLVLVIYTDLRPPANHKPMFTGSFEFIKARQTDIGPPEANSLCNHTIYGSEKREGEFQSVTYPGVYVKGLRCAYRFIGEPKQRIRLEFLDLDLYSGGTHCPLDHVKIFDGLEETDPIIQTICGSHRSLIVFSTKENLLVTFGTLQREAEVQNRGFSAYFEFSDKFVEPNFIQGQNAKHIRGSECDQRIISDKATKGLIISPDANHHTNAICRYIFEGLQTSLDYEKVSLRFTEFDLKTPRQAASNSQLILSPATTTPAPQTNLGINLLLFNQSLALQQDNSLNSSNSSNAEQCTDNYVRIYTGEQKPDQRQDPNDYDYVFCGNERPTQSVESDAASLLMEYNSGSIGGYFKAEYSFIVDFRIPGMQISNGCNYLYRSDYLKTGTFNSPRHPSWYINDINCSFSLLTKPDEALLLQFNTFKMHSSFDEKLLGFNETCIGEDQVEIIELTLDPSEQHVISQTEIGSYCGKTTPGPILSFKPLRINFQTNKDKVHYGFSASYNFYPIGGLKSNEFVTNCGNQITASQRLRSGSFSSPETYRPETYEKRNHICFWNITARPSHRIALDFGRFELEGNPVVRGCSTASVRLYTGRSKIPTEICGTLSRPASNSSNHQFVSDNEWLGLIFISTKQASGSSGFTATWMEIKRTT